MIRPYCLVRTMAILPAVCFISTNIDASYLSYEDGFLEEISDKLIIAKEIIDNQCYSASTSSFSNLAYTIDATKQKFITEWGCHNSNGTRNNLVSGYVIMGSKVNFL